MKIVINAFSARLGGGQTYLRQLLTHLPDDDDLDIMLFAPANMKIPADKRIRRGRTRWPTRNPLARAVWERLGLPAILSSEDADILFCPGGVVATKAIGRVKTVTMFRNMIPFTPRLVNAMPWGLQRLRNIILKRVMLESMARANLTIFISDFARSTIMPLVQIPNPITISHGISAAFRTAADAELPRPVRLPSTPYLLYVSRFDGYKHHDEVVTAYAALPERLRRSQTLVLVGEDDSPIADHVRRKVETLEISDSVIVAGPVPYVDLPAWYRHATATIFASSCENCPNILLESLGAGRPVICSDVMPMPEFGGEGLIYFSPFDPTSLTCALIDVLSDATLATRCANAATERSLHYNWADTAKRTWDALRQLAQESSTVTAAELL